MTELVTRQNLQTDLQGGLDPLRAAVNALEVRINTAEARLEARIDTLALRLTVRLGGIVAAGIGILALIQRLH